MRCTASRSVEDDGRYRGRVSVNDRSRTPHQVEGASNGASRVAMGGQDPGSTTAAASEFDEHLRSSRPVCDQSGSLLAANGTGRRQLAVGEDVLEGRSAACLAGIGACPTIETIDRGIAGRARQGVVAGVAFEDVSAGPAVERVIALATVEGVAARVTGQRVDARAAGDGVVAVAAGQRVVARASPVSSQ